ncbi:MAG TPA: M50 family metallopeptidase [Minicystis sp.]|nr:M50 family metallopeptidase [Minicystis sp.]
MAQSTLIGILGLALLMVLHEAGHFVAARAFGMRVTRFSIGFGPTLFKLVPKDGYFWLTVLADRFQVRLFKHDPARHGPTIYQVAVIPFLAYVQIAGMNPLEDVEEGDKGSYANASLIGRIVTIFSGPFANYVFASVFFFLSFFFGGRIDVDMSSTAVDVLPNRAAAAAHMVDGDRIVQVGGTKVKDWEQMAAAISQHPAETIPIVVDRKGQEVTLTVTPANENGKGKIGVQAMKHHVVLDAKDSVKLAITHPPAVVKDVVVGIGKLITGKAEGELVGPVGIVKETAKAAESSWTEFCYILGIISAYLGAFNLIPFPALDGGRLMFLGYEATTRKRPNARIEAHIHAIGLVMMISLMVYVTVAKDLRLGLK